MNHEWVNFNKFMGDPISKTVARSFIDLISKKWQLKNLKDRDVFGFIQAVIDTCENSSEIRRVGDGLWYECLLPPKKYRMINDQIPVLITGWFPSNLAFIVVAYCEVEGKEIKRINKGFKWVYRGVTGSENLVKLVIDKSNVETDKEIKKRERIRQRIADGRYEPKKAHGWYNKKCENCGRLFLTKRSDSRACPMSACKKALSRRGTVRTYAYKKM